MAWGIAVVGGLLIGLLLGALGGGGAILAVPVLVYLLGQTPQEATASSLVIVGVTAAISTVHHARSGTVRWVVGIGFATAGMPASLLGAALNERTDAIVVLVSFALVMLASAGAMLWRTRPRSASSPDAAERGPIASSPDAGERGPIASSPDATERASTTSSPGAVSRGRRGAFPNTGLIGKVLGVGLVIGFLTGFLGVGGGFIIVPALVAVLDMPMSRAVGTSLFIMALNAGMSLLPRMSGDHLDWVLVVPFTAAAVLGSLVGTSVADRLPAAILTRAFAALLIMIGIGVIALEVIA